MLCSFSVPLIISPLIFIDMLSSDLLFSQSLSFRYNFFNYLARIGAVECLPSRQGIVGVLDYLVIDTAWIYKE